MTAKTPAFLQDLSLWFLAMVRQIAALATGGVGTALLFVWSLNVSKPDEVERLRTAQWTWLALSILVAAFLSWRVEHRASDLASKERDSEASALAAERNRNRPNFKGRVGSILTEQFGASDLSMVAILKVRNGGTPSKVFDCEIYMGSDHGHRFYNPASLMAALMTNPHYTSIARIEDLAPIDHGDEREGLLCAQFTDISDETLQALNEHLQGRVDYTALNIRVTYRDVDGNEYEAIPSTP